jgi:hypothetical protein
MGRCRVRRAIFDRETGAVYQTSDRHARARQVAPIKRRWNITWTIACGTPLSKRRGSGPVFDKNAATGGCRYRAGCRRRVGARRATAFCDSTRTASESSESRLRPGMGVKVGGLTLHQSLGPTAFTGCPKTKSYDIVGAWWARPDAAGSALGNLQRQGFPWHDFAISPQQTGAKDPFIAAESRNKGGFKGTAKWVHVPLGHGCHGKLRKISLYPRPRTGVAGRTFPNVYMVLLLGAWGTYLPVPVHM